MDGSRARSIRPRPCARGRNPLGRRGDRVSQHRHPELEVFAAVPALLGRLMKFSGWSRRCWRQARCRLLEAPSAGPAARGRAPSSERGRSYVWGEASDGHGRRVVSRLRRSRASAYDPHGARRGRAILAGGAKRLSDAVATHSARTSSWNSRTRSAATSDRGAALATSTRPGHSGPLTEPSTSGPSQDRMIAETIIAPSKVAQTPARIARLRGSEGRMLRWGAGQPEGAPTGVLGRARGRVIDGLAIIAGSGSLSTARRRAALSAAAEPDEDLPAARAPIGGFDAQTLRVSEPAKHDTIASNRFGLRSSRSGAANDTSLPSGPDLRGPCVRASLARYTPVRCAREQGRRREALDHTGLLPLLPR